MEKKHSQMLSRFRYKHFALLVALDEHRNLHRAAAAVHLAQPTASKLVRDMEGIFGFALFERKPRGMNPTELGVEVVAFARRVLVDLERLSGDLETRKRGALGQLIVGAI